MFDQLENIFHRPEPFEILTARELWTDEHTSRQMLKYHLDPEVDLSSRNAAFIERSVEWIVNTFSIGKKSRIADFGCGPGLYTNRLAQHSDNVTGIDFSSNSLACAKDRAEMEGLRVNYVLADYLEFDFPGKYDLIIMIMCDFCALSPEQRRMMQGKFHSMLEKGGQVLLDVYSMNAFNARQEAVICAKNLLNGFWAPGDYYGFLHTWKYATAKVILDKYTIVEPHRIRSFFNWLQYFSPAGLLEEFRLAGFTEKTLFSSVAGDPFDDTASEFAIVARKP